MGFMQVYRVGDTSGDSPMGKISRLLTGEGIDTDDLGDRQPDSGCVLIDLMAGEDNVKKVAAAVPQLPQILVTSTEALGSRQLGLTDEIVSPDMPDPEIVRRVECMQNLAIRVMEEVPEPTQTRVLLDGETEGDEANLKALAEVLEGGDVEWEPLQDENDKEGTGIIYTHYRRASYARLLQGDYPGYIHIQMAATPELRVEALTVGDISYTPKVEPEEILARHTRFLAMLERLRNPEGYRETPTEKKALRVLFVGDRNVGNSLRTGLGEDIRVKTMATTAGGRQEASKHKLVLIQPGGKEDAKERLAFLQMLLKQKDHPDLALLFLKAAPAQIKSFCESQGVTLIESGDSDTVARALRELGS